MGTWKSKAGTVLGVASLVVGGFVIGRLVGEIPPDAGHEASEPSADGPRALSELVTRVEELEELTNAMPELTRRVVTRVDALTDAVDDLANNQIRVDAGEVIVEDIALGWPVLERDKQRPAVRGGLRQLPRVGATDRGILGGRVHFQAPFSAPPSVHVGLSMLDADNAQNTRVWASVTSVDIDGFNFDLFTWADTGLFGAELAWIAIGK